MRAQPLMTVVISKTQHLADYKNYIFAARPTFSRSHRALSQDERTRSFAFQFVIGYVWLLAL